MRYFLIIILLFTGFIAHAQYNEIENEVVVEQANYALKFSMRLFSPRIDFEKILNDKGSIGFVTKGYLYWIPQGVRIEPYYRFYFKKNAPFKAYLQPKAGLGYFDFSLTATETRGLSVGGGVLFGAQFNIGKKKALIDFFGGVQYMYPIYLQDNRYQSTNNPNLQIGLEDYTFIHTLFMAFPVETGLRFGFYKTKKKTVANIEKDFY